MYYFGVLIIFLVIMCYYILINLFKKDKLLIVVFMWIGVVKNVMFYIKCWSSFEFNLVIN